MCNVRIGVMSKGEAEKKKRAILCEADKGVRQERESSTVSEYLTSWLDTRQRQLATTTFVRYRHMVSRDVNPVIGAVQLKTLDTCHIEQVYSTAYSRGLSGQSCLHIHRLLHNAFRDAVRKKKLLTNVVDLVESPRPEERQLVPVSRERVKLLIEAAQGSRLAAPIAVAAVTGLRRGELLALRWRSIDFTKGSLFVDSALEHTREHGVRFKAPKSKSSQRPIPLAPEGIEVLLAHKAEQDRAKDDAGDYYVDNDLVFPNPDGSPWPPDTFSVQFGKLAALVGLKGFRFHDVRHAFASLALADGTSIKEVQALMGHSSPTVTLSVYARAMEGLGRKAVNGLSRSLLGRQKAGAPLPTVTKTGKMTGRRYQA
jgi:integrase